MKKRFRFQEHHVVIDEGVAATCETAGKTEGSHCSVCGTVLKAQEEIPATGHTIVEVSMLAPDLQTPESKGSHCSECGFVFQTQQEIPPTGHSWTEKEITKEATCTRRWRAYTDLYELWKHHDEKVFPL